MSKRDVANSTLIAEHKTEASSKTESVSDNISLFQSLKVLQDDDDDDDDYEAADSVARLSDETCLRTATVSGLVIGFSLIMCTLLASLAVACTKLRNRKNASIYDSYQNHKGRID